MAFFEHLPCVIDTTFVFLTEKLSSLHLFWVLLN